MSSKNISLAAAAALVMALVYWFGLRGDDAPAPKPSPAAQQAPTKVTPTVRPPAKTKGERETPRAAFVVNYDDDPVGSLRLEGQVITTEDDPVVGAMVSIDSRPPRFAKTDESGSFFFENLVARNYDLVAKSDSGAAGPVTARLSETNDPIMLVVREGGAVEVSVTNGAGEAVIGADVQLRGIDVQSAVSDSEGLVSFSQVPMSRYEVVAKASGFAIQRTSVVVSRIGATAEVSLVLKTGARVAGVVLDADGKPLADARVSYGGASNWSMQADSRLDSIVSGADGSFAIEALPKGSVRFVADAKGHAQGSSEVIELDGETETTGVEVRMEAAAVVRGRVINSEGAPVAAARVRVTAKEGGVVRRGGGVRQSYTDDEGRYEIGELRRRTYEVMALHETASSEIVAADLGQAPHDVTLDIPLSIEGVIAGTVVDSAGEPVAGAQVSLFPDFEKGSSRTASEWRMRGIDTELTDAGGVFRITGLAADKHYKVRAVPGTSNNPGRAWLTEGVGARTGDEDVRIVLPADGGIRGKVTLASGEAPAVFTVSVGWQSGTPFSSKDGSFELSDLPPQSFSVVIKGPEFDEKRVADVVVKEGAYTELGNLTVVQGRSVSGVVVDDGGKPVEGATVSAGREIFGDGSNAVASGGARSPLGRATKSSKTDAEGQFSIRGVVAGDLSVVADHETIGRSMPIYVPQSNDSLEGLKLALLPTGALGGVVSKGKEPAGGVVITAASVDYPGVTFNVASGSDGSYRFDRLIADRYRVRAMFDGNPMVGMSFFAEQADVVAESVTELDIHFASGIATVRVILTGDKPLGFSWISLVGPDVAVSTARELRQIQGKSFGFEAASMSITGMPATMKGVPVGSFQVCALVYPSEVSGMSETMSYGERHGDDLPAQCTKFEIAEGAEEVEVPLQVVVPAFVSDSNSNDSEESDSE